MLFSLTSLISLARGSLIRAVITAAVGMFLSTVGTDPLTGTTRLSFGSVKLMLGFDLVPIAVGLFGIGEILYSSEQGISKIFEGKLGKMMPRGRELTKGLKGCIRGTVIGYILGLLPGMVTAVTTFIAYDVEKRISRNPNKFGSGAIEGVASPEAANNATAMAGFVPLLSLGIPTSPALALILACLMIYGLTPGPLLFVHSPEFVWAIIASMYVGNVILLILNLPLVGMWARISKIPYKILAPIILGVCVIGAYAPRNTMFDVWVAIGAGILGYIMRKGNWPIAPLILGFILGPLLEQALRNSIEMSFGSVLIFFERPISLGFLIMAFASITLIPILARRRLILDKLKEEDE
jgi:putative tricarboxylic transport membrane protein